jgi:hypothetical protein
MEIRIKEKLDQVIAANRSCHRHPVWQHLHFAHTILRRATEIKARPYPPSVSHHISIREYPNWVSNQWQSLSQLVDQVTAFTKDRAGFGRLSELSQMQSEHDVEVVARPFLTYYQRAFEWNRTVLATPVDVACLRGRDELAQWGKAITVGLESFANQVKKESEDIADLAPDRRYLGRITLNLAWPSDADNLATLRWIREVLSNLGSNSSPSAGYLYLLVNPSMDGLVKIGKTQRDPKARAKELGSVTGIPTPFLLVFDLAVDDCTRAEQYVHNDLAKYRLSSNREFFRVELSHAIRVMLESGNCVATDRNVLHEFLDNYPFETTREQQDLIIAELQKCLARKRFAPIE